MNLTRSLFVSRMGITVRHLTADIVQERGLTLKSTIVAKEAGGEAEEVPVEETLEEEVPVELTLEEVELISEEAVEILEEATKVEEGADGTLEGVFAGVALEEEEEDIDAQSCVFIMEIYKIAIDNKDIII